MKVAVNRVFITIYVLCVYLLNKVHNRYRKGMALIIAPHIFGDATLLLASFQSYVNFYEKKGLKVNLLCRPAVLKFMRDVAPLPESLSIEAVDFTKLVNDFSYFREVSKKYRHEAEIVIAPGTSMSVELLATTFPTNERYAFAQGKRNFWPPHIYLFFRLAYTDIIFPPIDMMQIQRHRMFMNHLGMSDYKGHIAHFYEQEPVVAGNYCVICPGSSMSFKCWPLERFREVTDWIIETYNIDVHICGGGEEEEAMANELISKSRNKGRIVSHVNKTSFKEWSSIVQHAKFVLGNDSATIHIAASTQRPSVCIAGAYDKNQFFPYAVDEMAEGDVLPVTLLKDVPCRNCRTKSYHAGYGNEACLERIKNGFCARCIDEITVDEVRRKIKELVS